MSLKIVVESSGPVDDIAPIVRHVLFAIALVGCARGGVGQLTGDGNQVVIDGEVFNDAPDQHHDDAKVYLDAKQFEDAHEFKDAHVFMDAHVYMDACTQVQTELLTNPGFDSGPTPEWHEVQYSGELIVTQFPQAGTYGAWLGGYTGPTGGVAVDEVFQDVAVPAGTTTLNLTGYYLVYTSEDTSDMTPYDVASVSLVHPAGETPIETALQVDNYSSNNNTPTYVPFTHSFAVAGVAGTTVRLKLTSSNDDLNYSNFFFDTLSLKATYCP